MKYVAVAAVSGLLALGGCQSDPSLNRLTAGEKIGTSVEVNEAGEEVICRRTPMPNSRVRFTKTCGTQAQWDLWDEETRRNMQDSTKNRAASPSS